MPKLANLLATSAPEHHRCVPRHLPCLSAFRARLLARAQTRMGPQLRVQVDPADIVHETLLKAHRARSQFRGRNECQLEAWLNSILTNSIKNAVRSLRITASLSERLRASRVQRSSGEPCCPVRTALRNEELCRLSEAMAQIPRNQRFALELRFLEGCSLAEIRDRTGRTRASVTGLLQRGLRAIRARFRDAGRAPESNAKLPRGSPRRAWQSASA
jgi:RNA polymerase sigma-70 factor (ECF subfamily)